MNRFDYLDLDGRTIRLFLTVLEENSVTGAAARLGVTQSAVSHSLDKLRDILGDPLFVRAGRGIVPTRHAEWLAGAMQPLLSSLKQITQPQEFDPAQASGLFTIGANDYQRELIMPPLVRQLRKTSPLLDLRIVESRFSDAESLQKSRSDLLISPNPPVGMEFIQKKLFSDRWVCFFDPESHPPPATMQTYLARPHAKVVFTDDDRSVLDEILQKDGRERRISLQVSRFYALPSLMRGTDLVVTLPGKIERNIMREFSICPVPIPIPPLTFYLVWHLRDQTTPLNRWIRQQIEAIAKTLEKDIPKEKDAR